MNRTNKKETNRIFFFLFFFLFLDYKNQKEKISKFDSSIGVEENGKQSQDNSQIRQDSGSIWTFVVSGKLIGTVKIQAGFGIILSGINIKRSSRTGTVGPNTALKGIK